MKISPAAAVVVTLWLSAFIITLSVKRTPAALAGGLVFGLLFLPQFIIDLPFLPLNKNVLLSLTGAFGVFLIDPRQRPAFRLSFLDLPVIVLSLAGFGASLSNGLGIYDGLASSTRLFCLWGMPFLIGRVAFGSQPNALTFIRMLILGALIYVPFCLFEMKMAPILHALFYGYQPRFQNDFTMAVRYGLWRPVVFMEFGLQLALFMGISSVIAGWGALSGKIPRVANLSTNAIAGALGITTVLCVSTGAVLLTVFGWGLLFLSRFNVGRILLLGLLFIPVAYPVFRMLNPGGIELDSEIQNDELSARRDSLNTRIESEELYLARWRLHPLLGSTPWYFGDVDGRAIPDSMWIQILGCYGLIGWTGFTIALLLPLSVWCFRGKAANAWHSSGYTLGLAALLYLLDCLFNAFENPLYVVMAGAAISIRYQEPDSDELNTAPKRTPKMRRQLWPLSPANAEGAV